MALIGGLCLRLTGTAVRALQLLAAIVVLAIYSYFLATLKDHKLPIYNRYRAVEGISGAGVLYTIFGVLLTFFLGGITPLAFAAVVLDILFCGAFLYCAWVNRGGAHSCSGNVNTVLGSGPSNSKAAGYGADGFGFGSNDNVTYLPNLHRACELEKAVFAVCIILAGLFLISAPLQVLISRHHKKEKRYGPGPSNNYTSGAGRQPFWRRNKNKRNTRDAEMATAGHHDKHGIRPSHDTGYTGTTTVDNGVPGQNGYGYAHPATTGTNY